MATRIDWDSGYDEAVEVNQRALIDKVLARYSAEFTVFRELLQNSDDARSRRVEIHFQSEAFLEGKSVDENALPNLKTAPVRRWVFKNDGMAFRDEDWSRLKKIAEGNPDEDKIGAFGVGFYSLFSVTDEPKVLSGDQWMWFYWNKDQLIARRGPVKGNDPPSEGEAEPEINEWTSFEMPLREDSPIPVAFDFTRFLASSITFMTHLSQVSVFFDDKCLVKLSKSAGSPKLVDLPKHLEAQTKSRTMRIVGFQSTPLDIKAEVMRWVYSSGTERPPPPQPVKPTITATSSNWFSSFFRTPAPTRPATPLPPPPPVLPIDHLAVSTTNVSLSIYSAQAETRLNNKVAAEIHRSTKKKPPARLRYDLIYTAKDRYDESKKEDEELPFATGSVFQGLRADLEGTGAGRVFIGHATAQTTGLGGHMSSRFIPTVERESIDLMDRNVAIWNRELLYIGGIVARAAYELELGDIKMLWDGATSASGPPDAELQTWLTGRAIHTLKFFTFHQSTPSPDIASIMEAAFFSCTVGKQFSIMSSVGVRDATEVRLPDPTFTFLKNLPVLADEVLNGARPMVTSLQTRGLIRHIRFDDVLRELQDRPLPEEEMTACIKWWAGIKGTLTQSARTSLLNNAVLVTGTPGSENERIIPLSAIRTFFNHRSGLGIPLEGPLPDDMLPMSISKHLTPEQLTSSFPWRALSILDWLQHVCTTPCAPEFDIRLSPPWAEKVLTVIIRGWPSTDNETKLGIINMLQTIPCIPTSAGMKVPQEAYFASADIFHDLPVVTLPSGAAIKGPMERILTALKVRKHIDLQVISTRMLKTKKWTTAELVKYLVSVRDTLSEEEIDRLKATVAFSAENQDSEKRYQARQLYEPLDVFRRLGLPVLDWGKQTRWRGSSDEAKFLFELGLKRQPPLAQIIRMCADVDVEIRELSLTYLVDHIPAVYSDYDPVHFREVKFIPSTKDGQKCLCSPQEVYANPKWATFDLPILASEKSDLAAKLKIKDHPVSTTLINILTTRPPKSVWQGIQWFGVLAAHVGDFSGAQRKKLSQLPIIPVLTQEQKVIHRPPNQCYFRQEDRQTLRSKLFVFIHFGPVANSFLSACGVELQPTTDEVAQMLLNDPSNFYRLAVTAEYFLMELKAIAAHSHTLSAHTVARMQKTPVLLAFQRKQASGKAALLDDEEREMIPVGLKTADQIIIADDTNAMQLFGDSLLTAPQDNTLEDFYFSLGSPRLSSLVKEDPKHTDEVQNSKQAAEIRNLILERLPLFLHEHTHAKTRLSYKWLKTGNNFLVKSFGKVSITKQLNHGDLRLSQAQDASAVSYRPRPEGSLELWLAGNTQIDMYEVAMSFNRYFFDAPKANDTLLLMTLLSSDLRSLKRRGYNVDRILREQDAQRQAIREAQIKAALEKEKEEADNQPPVIPPPLPPINDKVPALASDQEVAPVSSSPKRQSTKMKNWGQKLKNITHSGPGTGKDASAPGPPPLDRTTRPPIQHNPTQGATPLQNIAANIDMAIQGCRPEAGNLIQNREQMQRVKESLDEGYCDVSGRVGDLKEIGKMGGVKVYLSYDVPRPEMATFMSEKRDSIARLVHLMMLLSQIYNVPVTNLHIFHDQGGGLIAFNRNGSIFFNLRYFIAWHDEEVARNELKTALISWYFTLAHEIAHNLVQPHNSEHEFYFSALCEKHLMNLGAVLATL